jgi:serine/threonine protein kinase
MEISRIQAIDRLSRLLWDNASDTWFPEDQWRSILKIHIAEDDPALLESVCQFARRVKGSENGELNLPRVIGEYTLVRFIGKGGMGTVYEAVYRGQVFTFRRAVKMLNVGLNTKPFLKRFQEERDILCRLDHPNIVQPIADGISADNRPYFVTALVLNPEDIDRYCALKKLSLGDRLGMFRVLCSAISYAHSKGVIHRDLKPSNILVSEDGMVKVIDFGLGKSLFIDANSPKDDETLTGQFIIGTPGRMSPEQQKGEEQTEASDIYCLGLVLHDMLKTLPDYAVPARKGDRWNTWGPVDLVIWNALRPEPGDRYTSVEALSQRVLGILNPASKLQLEPILFRKKLGRWLFAHRAVSMILTGAFLSASFFLVTNYPRAKTPPSLAPEDPATQEEQNARRYKAEEESIAVLKDALADMYWNLLLPAQRNGENEVENLAKRVTDFATAGNKRLRLALSLHRIYGYEKVIVHRDLGLTYSTDESGTAALIALKRYHDEANPTLLQHFSAAQALEGYNVRVRPSPVLPVNADLG